MKALVRCHLEYPFLKFLGWCNEQKYDLARCLEQEKKEMRKARQAAAKDIYSARKQETLELLEKLEAQRARKAAAAAAAAGGATAQ